MMSSRDEPQANRPPIIQDWTPAAVFRGTVVVLAVGLGIWLLFAARQALFSLFAAIVISTALSPAVGWLQRRGVPRGLGVILIFLGLFGLAAAAILMLAPVVVEQGPRILAALGSRYTEVMLALHTSPSRMLQRLALQLPLTLSVDASAGATDETLDAVAQAMHYLGLAGDGLFILAAVLLLAFYWTLERERVVRSVMWLLPAARRDEARHVLAESEARVGGYIRGVALLCAIVGAVAFGAYLVMGLPNALLLGLAAGLFEAVPVVGPVLGALPAVVVALTVNPSAVVWVLAATVAVQLLENAVLVPRVMRRAVGVNPVVTLLAVVGLGGLFGIAGSLLAIPLAAVAQLLLDRFVVNGNGRGGPLPGRDHLNVLRFDARELALDARKQLRAKTADQGSDDDHLEDALEAMATELDALLAQAAAPAPSAGPANPAAREGAA
jgi:predicted PurR-regulated permease PerM